METTERLELAALQIEDSIYTGETSSAAAKQFFRARGDKQEKLGLLLRAKDGFLTSRGRFVSQQEGTEIARIAGQTLLFGMLVPDGRGYLALPRSLLPDCSKSSASERIGPSDVRPVNGSDEQRKDAVLRSLKKSVFSPISVKQRRDP